METIDTDNLIYLSAFLVLIGGSYLLSQRRNIGQVMRHAGVWVLIFLGAILAVAAWEDISGAVTSRATVSQDGSEIRVPRSVDGHYYLTLEVNGAATRFVVDTGATDIVLTQEDAEKAGIARDSLVFAGRAQTANGVVETAPVRLESVAIGPVVDRNVRAIVNGGDLHESLLGMGYLDRFGTIMIQDGELILRR
ncbi:MAG: TIGR02281 family clan AA aspartic protease [Pseudomonadota bacterium]